MSKKTSMVVYEDWIIIATEMLNGDECKTFLQNILNVYKNEEVVLNTPMLKSVWKLVGDEVVSNKEKRDAKVERITEARKNNSKHQVSKDVEPSMKPIAVLKPKPRGVNVNVNVNDNDNVNGKWEDEKMDMLMKMKEEYYG